MYNERKTYVTVLVKITPDGRKIPREIIWRNGHRYVIDRITEAHRAAARHVTGTGMRYEVQIGERKTYIWDEEGRWFVEEHLG